MRGTMVANKSRLQVCLGWLTHLRVALYTAGKVQLEEGQKLRFSMPLPYTREALRDLLSPTKEMVTDAVKERIRAQRAAGKEKVFLAEPVRAPAQENTILATAK